MTKKWIKVNIKGEPSAVTVVEHVGKVEKDPTHEWGWKTTYKGRIAWHKSEAHALVWLRAITLEKFHGMSQIEAVAQAKAEIGLCSFADELAEEAKTSLEQKSREAWWNSSHSAFGGDA